MEGTHFCYPAPQWYAQALGASCVESWVKASRQPYWYRPAALAVLAPLDWERDDDRARTEAYDTVRAVQLRREMVLFAREHGVCAGVAEVYWSAGVTALSERALRAVHQAVAECFDVEAGAAFTASVAASRPPHAETLAALREFGVTTLHTSIDAKEPRRGDVIEPLMAAARDGGFRSIAVEVPVVAADASVRTARAWVEALVACRPSRILLSAGGNEQAAGGHRHMADTEARLQLIRQETFARLISAGYEYIAHDAFALRSDEWVGAKRVAALTPRPYGYSTRIPYASIAIGPGAIGNVGPMQYQNARDADAYADMLAREVLPVERGLLCTPDDLVRRTILAGLLANFSVDIESIEECYGIDFHMTFQRELAALEPLARKGYVELDAKRLGLTPVGRFACGRVADAFDRYLRQLEQARREPEEP